jgi:receptor protein-tyrosine kinase
MSGANLSIAFARKGHRVLIVDCDMYNPSVFRALKMERGKTVRDYQEGTAEAMEIFVKTGVRHLYATEANVDFKDIKTKELLQRILKGCANTFDYVILDTPPCSLLVDAAELSDLAEYAMMVIRQDYASRSQIVEGVKLLTDNGLPLIGCALNGVAGNLAANGYRYGNGYGYGYGYSYGYGYGTKKKDTLPGVLSL